MLFRRFRLRFYIRMNVREYQCRHFVNGFLWDKQWRSGNMLCMRLSMRLYIKMIIRECQC